jgi:pimeloyl-ACP methyl ester carboxylesterase
MKSALLVHGLLRGPMSMMPLAPMLRQQGYRTHFFYYSSPIESFERIIARLSHRLKTLKPEVVIGHSLGGLLLRLAIERAQVPIEHLFMMGTPNQSPRIARYFWKWRLFRWATGESGRFLADPSEYSKLPMPSYPYTSFAGIRGIKWFFGNELNDGLVSLSESQINDSTNSIPIDAIHTLLTCSSEIRDSIRAKLQFARMTTQ